MTEPFSLVRQWKLNVNAIQKRIGCKVCYDEQISGYFVDMLVYS